MGYCIFLLKKYLPYSAEDRVVGSARPQHCRLLFSVLPPPTFIARPSMLTPRALRRYPVPPRITFSPDTLLDDAHASINVPPASPLQPGLPDCGRPHFYTLCHSADSLLCLWMGRRLSMHSSHPCPRLSRKPLALSTSHVAAAECRTSTAV